MLIRSLGRPLIIAALLFTASGWATAQDRSTLRGARSSRGAAEEAAPFTLTAEQAANPPKRELEFEELSDNHERVLPRPDPKLLEKKFVARFSLTLPEIQFYDNELNELNRLQDTGRGLLMFPHHSRSVSQSDDPFGNALRRMLEAMPKDKRPAEEDLKFLSESPLDIEMVTSTAVSPEGQTTSRHIHLFTKSPEEGRRSVAALLTILDYGLTRPYQLHYFEQREEVLAQVESERQAVEKVNTEHDNLQKDAEELADFPGELLPNLRGQQLQLEADLAGAKSRIEACEALIAGDKPLSLERRAMVGDLKITAEIDLASIEARQKAMGRFVENARRSVRLQQDLREVATRLALHTTRLRSHQSKQRSLEKRILAYRPLPLTGKVYLQPLKWTQ